MTETAEVPKTLDAALEVLNAHAEPEKADGMAAYHKVERPYLGVANPVLNDLAQDWRRALTLDERLQLASALWQSNIHEARVVAAKLLTQARIKPSDAEAWWLICSWVPEFDAWAIADHVCMAGQRRVMADLSRLDEIAAWTTHEHLWTKRAALVITLGLTRLNHPDAAQQAARERVLGWAADYLSDERWFIQKAVAWWLRDLSKHDPERARAFLAEHGEKMRNFARKEAGKYLK
ncbi:3-methyladenine DNA glycosylase AlkD [Pseudooceanicola antarcticus]|uniref:3-methyladenine DNA glycosylase AlkD n=1 Tax=Pseudooceanicola antarcticus TaxID=1247613 RepID=A0A285J345_9RHOB|nr:DNA alkylation repair protein [Pseudooceanicola antarcticus]PJE29763.1 DNA alkylation repair protein [Pseudooceanicola antarcticus]SNY54493.1 3-methyladenine DNA glycosylase AlkD [Pseudooceanicola antarcticus]